MKLLYKRRYFREMRMVDYVDDCDMQDICAFCAEVGRGQGVNLFHELGVCDKLSYEYIFEETKSFVVMPCVGALVDTYFLIVSKRHVLSTGWLSSEERDELRSLLGRWKAKIDRNGLFSAVFEHGSYSFRDKGGSCYDHCHVHLIGAEQSPSTFVDQVARDVELTLREDWLLAAAEVVRRREHSYLAVSYDGGDFVGNSSGAPSQFFRRHLTSWLKAEKGSWDWLAFPEESRVRNMISLYGS